MITSVETFGDEFVAMVRVRTDRGDEGWGQVAPYHADLTCQVLHRQVAPHALGRDEEDIEGLVAMLPEREHKFPGSHLMRAIGGIDTALWDLRGRRAGVSVCELLGGTPRRFPVYGSSMRRDIEPSQEADRLARLQDEHGYRAVKVRIGRELGHDEDEWPGRTEAVVAAVRAALDPATRLLVDANSCYTPRRAIEVGLMLQASGVVHYEEPCPYWEPEWTAEVAAALELDVTGGEQDCMIADWRRMADLKAVDIMQPDVCYVGGLTRTLQVARIAQEAGLPVVPHSANLSMVTVFALHLMGAIPNAGPYVEYSIEPDEYYPWQVGLFQEPWSVVDGEVEIPGRPGWGVEIAPEWLARASRSVTELP